MDNSIENENTTRDINHLFYFFFDKYVVIEDLKQTFFIPYQNIFSVETESFNSSAGLYWKVRINLKDMDYTAAKFGRYSSQEEANKEQSNFSAKLVTETVFFKN